MDDLIATVPLPPRIDSLAELEALAALSPYFAKEDSPQWRAHFNACSPTQKGEENNKRRLWMFLSHARMKMICLYCWVPTAVCMCERIMSRAEAVQSAMMKETPSTSTVTCTCTTCDSDNNSTNANNACAINTISKKGPPPRPECRVTIILHSSELLRMTNSAHIAAMTMDAGMLVWGLPEHDEKIARLGRYWARHPTAETSLGWPIAATERKRGEKLACGEKGPTEKEEKNKKAKGEGGNANYARSVTTSLLRKQKKATADGAAGERNTTKKLRGDASSGSESDASSDNENEGVDKRGKGEEEDDVDDEDARLDAGEMSVLLYPAVDASVPFEQLLAYRAEANKGAAAGSASKKGPISAIKASDTYTATDACATAPTGDTESHSCSNTAQSANVPPLHIYLSDGTWSQARVVNRQLNPLMPRVALEISPRYGALFHGLRKRTRESGVSTLEATTIAVAQSIAFDASCGLFAAREEDKAVTVSYGGQRSGGEESEGEGEEGGKEKVRGEEEESPKRKCSHNKSNQSKGDAPPPMAPGATLHQRAAHNAQGEEVAITTVPASVLALEDGLFRLMREFVDIVSILSTKHDARERQTTLTEAELTDLIARENAYKVAMQHLYTEEHCEPEATALHGQLPAPVANYCYMCDVFIGFERMAIHVAGKDHQRRRGLASASFEPSAYSLRCRKNHLLPIEAKEGTVAASCLMCAAGDEKKKKRWLAPKDGKGGPSSQNEEGEGGRGGGDEEGTAAFLEK